MIPKECKRLAEVDFPIARVSGFALSEKKIRHGLPSTLHLWWARRPLAACRSMLMALLLPDPCDPYCPPDFKIKARSLFNRPMIPIPAGKTDEELRQALLKFIGDFANWDNSAHPVYLEIGRGLVKAAHPEDRALVVDPFAGGGSIPLEALRLGCDAFASDLNPVACLINKVLLEDIPRNGPDLANELRQVGNEVKRKVESQLAAYYPVDSDGARPITYLWARTVRCESPNCGAEIPLVRSLWLCKKANRKYALRFGVVQPKPKGSPPRIEFEIFEPTIEAEVPGATVNRAKATCPCCKVVLSPDRVRTQLRDQRGGANAIFDGKGTRIGGARLLAVVTLRSGEQGRNYRLPRPKDYEAVYKALCRLKELSAADNENSPSFVPNENIPLTELRRISLPIYGVQRFSDMFSGRQLLCLGELTRNIAALDFSTTPSRCAHLLALSLDKTVDLNNANTPWKPDAECPVHTLARHDIAAAWDFAEAFPLGETSGSFFSAYERTADAIGPSYCKSTHTATIQVADACSHPLPHSSAAVWFTDPPYYDSVPYAHLSDFFYIWLRRHSLVHVQVQPVP